MFGEILQKFAEKSPVTVMVRGLLEHLLNADKIDTWFDSVRQAQYTKEILFSSIVSLMLQVVCKIQASVHSAYQHSTIEASVVAVYDKLKGVEAKTSQELVRQIASESEVIIRNMKGANEPLLPGYRIKLLDGNCLESSERRLKVLRDTRAGALPGKSLVVFDAELGLAMDVFPCEDGHAQERALLAAVAATVQPGEVWIADRNFCVTQFLFDIHHQAAFFVIRWHQKMPYKPLSELAYVGTSATGEVFEQPVQLTSAEGETLMVRRVVIQLAKPTRNGDTFVAVLTNLPEAAADALAVAELYRKRWGIETAFQKLESHLHSEINTLGYPKAALFGFCLALVAFNLYAIVMAALRSTHRDHDINAEVSEYYIAGEIARTYTGMVLIIPEADWTMFAQASHAELGAILLDLAAKMDLSKFKKHKRGPKKPPTSRNKFKGHPHVSTAKLLASTSTG
jgi:Transposase DDE domain